jgi:hypothetical protein
MSLNMVKQTAVEWLESELDFLSNYMSERDRSKLFEQAKEMEKEQHANTWDDSRVEDRGDNYVGKQKSFNDYYEQTYGSNK